MMMKQSLKLTMLFVLLFAATTVFAQNKLGHIDSKILLQIMPEMEQAQKQLQAKADEYEKQMKELKTEYTNLISDFQKNEKTMSDVVKQTKVKAIRDCETRLQNFDQYAQTDLQKLQRTLMAPIYEKAKKTINDVAKENSFTYIFDLTGGSILYSAPNSIDIMPMVKAKLGLK